MTTVESDAVENYFNYFTEIEEHFQKRRGTALLLGTLDWALIETWKGAGIPLEAVLRGIDAAFDRYDARPTKTRKVNSLAYCAQEVLAAAEDMKEAATGTERKPQAPGLAPDQIVEYLARNAGTLENAAQGLPSTARTVAQEAARVLRELSEGIASAPGQRLEDVERRLTVLEEKMMAALLTITSDAELVAVRAQADRDLGPYRSKMPGAQIEQLQKQYAQKRLLEKHALPRLSLFYM